MCWRPRRLNADGDVVRGRQLRGRGYQQHVPCMLMLCCGEWLRQPRGCRDEPARRADGRRFREGGARNCRSGHRSAHRCSMCRVRKSGAAKIWREVLPPFPGRFLQPAIGHCTLASLVPLRTHKCLVVPFNLFRDVRCSLLLAAGTHEQPCGIRRTCAALTALPGHRAAVAELLTVPQRAQHATQHVGPDHGARHTMAHGNLHQPWHCSIAHSLHRAECVWLVRPGQH